MKRILAVLIALILVLAPTAALTEAAPDGAGDETDGTFEDAGDIFGDEIWLVPEDGGLVWDEKGMTISLPEDLDSGYAWTAELDAEAVLIPGAEANEEAEDGALPIHTFSYTPSADGEALVTLYYEQKDGDDTAAMLSYTATVEGGKLTDVAYEDMSDWDDEGDDEGGVLYDGESGGVPLYLPDDMTVVGEEDGLTRLENADKSIWMTVRYDPAGDPEALLGEFEDEAALTAEYTDASKGSTFLSTAVDRESDPPRGILVYETVVDGVDTIVEYTGYQAPNGGVLLVTTGYTM